MAVVLDCEGHSGSAHIIQLAESTTINTPIKQIAKTAMAEAKQPEKGKSGKGMCCACPETKEARDDCITRNGEEACKELIKAHLECLRADGFNI